MSTYTGVIAASQKRCNCGAERLTDLFVQQQYMYLTSMPYAIEQLDGIAAAFALDVELKGPPRAAATAALSGTAITASLVATVEYGTRTLETHAAALSETALTASLVDTVEYGTHTTETHTATLSGTAVTASLVVTVIDVDVPDDSAHGAFALEVTLV